MSLARATWVNVGILTLAGASLVGVWASLGKVGTSEREARGEDLLPLYPSEGAVHLELESRGQKLTLERSPEPDGGSATFRLLAPVKEPADPAAADKFLSALGKARVLRAVDSGPPLSAFGLEPPLVRVNVRTAKGSYRVLVGGNAPAPEGARYAQVTGDDGVAKVVVIDKAAAEDLSIDLDAFRQRGLVSLAEPEVTRIAIKSPSLDVTLQRSSGIAFMLQGKAPALADRETLSSLFFQLSRLSASRFLTADEAKAALQPVRAHFELDTKDSKQAVRFDVGGDCPSDPTQLVVVRTAPDPQSACAPRELEATLRLSAEDFVDRHPFSLHSDEVEELDITGGKSKFALLRKGNGFVLHAGSERQVELDAGNQRIQSLLEAVGERINDKRASELGLEPAALSITMRSSAARDADVVQQVVRVGNTDGAGNLFLYREQDGVVLRVPREAARYFVADSTLLYSHKLTQFGLSSFVSAEISSSVGKQLLLRGSNEALELREPKGFDPDGSTSSDLIQALGALTAERFVADHDDGTFGLGKPSVSVRFVSKSDTQTKTEHWLRFGDETPLGVYATLDEGGPVFVLQRSVRDTCDTLLINRSVFLLTPNSLNGIAIEAGARHLRLERHGEQLSANPAGSFAQERVPDLLEALGNLLPDAAIHTGPAQAAEGFAKPSMVLRLTPKQGAVQTVTFGAGDSWRGTSVFYLRVAGIDATFVLAQSKARALSEAL